MAYPGIGFKSYMQFKREASWGTDLAAIWRLPVLFIRPEPGASMIKSENMDGAITRNAMYKGPQLPRVTVGFEMNLGSEAILALLDLAMGTQAYGAIGATTTGPSAGVYTHTFINEEFLSSAVLELIEGNIPDTLCQQMTGAKVEELTLECTWAQDNTCILRGTITFVGKTYSSGATPTAGLSSYVATSSVPLLFSHVSTKDVGATSSPTLRSMTFKIKNNLATRPNLGSLYADEPVRGGFVDLSLDFSCDFTSKTALDEFLNATQGSPLIVFTTGPLSMTIDMGKGYITAHDHAVEGPGILEQKFTWEAIHDTAAAAGPTGVTITVVSSISAVV